MSDEAGLLEVCAAGVFIVITAALNLLAALIAVTALAELVLYERNDPPTAILVVTALVSSIGPAVCIRRVMTPRAGRAPFADHIVTLFAAGILSVGLGGSLLVLSAMSGM
jgi:Na+/H+ antiporter NhaD/arsenite permease-like protein